MVHIGGHFEKIPLRDSVGVKLHNLQVMHVEITFVTVHHKPPVKSAFFILRYRVK